jgi:hypothetical protein
LFWLKKDFNQVMKFLLRDDDTSYWTKPGDLESAFAHVWDTAPVSLACVPNVRGAAPGVVRQDNSTDENYYLISENEEIVRFIGELVKQGRASVMQHGWSHEDFADGSEYVAARDLENRTAEGKAILLDTFGGEILTFVPPHNSIGRSGTNAVAKEGMDILHAFSHRPLERNLDIPNITNFVRTLFMYVRYSKKRRWAHPYKFGDHLELGSYLLNRFTNVDEMKRSIDYVNDRDGAFCLATHYWEINRDGLHVQLEQIIDYASGLPDVEFVTDSGLWNQSNQD